MGPYTPHRRTPSNSLNTTTTAVAQNTPYNQAIFPPPTTSTATAATPLISPAKAALASQNARDWSLALTWLSRVLAPSSSTVPPFERNDETLATLLAMMRANGEADGLAERVEQAEMEEMEEFLKDEEKKWKHLEQRMVEEEDVEEEEDMIDTITSFLPTPGLEALHVLSNATVTMGVTTTTPPSSKTNTKTTTNLQKSLLFQTHLTIQTQTHLTSLQTLLSTLQRCLATLSSTLDDLHTRPEYQTPETLQAQMNHWVRETKMMGAKTAEYRDRVAGLARRRRMELELEGVEVEGEEDGGEEVVNIDMVKAEEEAVMEVLERVRGLEAKVKMFAGLPDDVQMAKKEYETVARQLELLVRQRDQLFEGLVERG